ncbi:protein kinase domain containing protein [Stylonychia lemnae]|uniref:non-specific serine/threonine protein kinase n=1 Tax=Stylonychia lemnae TaxID=5949 RepID=A0A078AJG7_STYLE|nr:protein kinase domain containing protein [Stylonychia lemnae]|eukprot:CDW80923.1 protein kinase domain containing protein [Stylonychia lemnae]
MENYERLEEIGKGSYGSVYKIRRKSDNQILVWKELDYGRMTEREKSQVVQEVNILSQLNHPNIVKYFDKIVDKEQKKIYIIMEYCENGDMAQLIKKCKTERDHVAEDVVWKIFVQIILALKECHNRKEGKVLHRDLKPGNVFFDIGNNVKLGDFGLSRILSQESEYAHTNVGTPYYMSPEQINEAQYNEKTDIWSSGCVLYEIIALRPPFEASNHLALAQKIIGGKIERIPERYSEDLQNVIEWMLSTEPEKRPSVNELSDIPKIKLRMKEREMRQEYAQLKQTDTDITKRMEELKKWEDEITLREDALREREHKAQQLKLQISQSSGGLGVMKSMELYQSMDNQMAFDKILHKYQMENSNESSNFRKNSQQSQSYSNQGQNDSMDNKYFQTTSQSSVTEILKKARQQSGSNKRPDHSNKQSSICELNDHNKTRRVDSQNRLFGDVSIASSIDASSVQMMGTGKKLHIHYSTASNNGTPKDIKFAPNATFDNTLIQNSMDSQKISTFQLSSKVQNSQQQNGPDSYRRQQEQSDNQNLTRNDSYTKTQDGSQQITSLRQGLPKKGSKISSRDQQSSATNIFKQINAQIQNGCHPRVQSAIPKGDSNIKSTQQLPPQSATSNSQKNQTPQLQIPNSLAERLALKDMEQPNNGRSSNLQKRPSSSSGCNSLTRISSMNQKQIQLQQQQQQLMQQQQQFQYHIQNNDQMSQQLNSMNNSSCNTAQNSSHKIKQ